jgi:hypothetical protein
VAHVARLPARIWRVYTSTCDHACQHWTDSYFAGRDSVNCTDLRLKTIDVSTRISSERLAR